MVNSKLYESKKYVTWRIRRRHINRDYLISKHRLDELRETHHNLYGSYNNVSEWIAHILDKLWAEKKLIIQLCEIIKKEKKENKIDWAETDRMIEEHLYYLN